MNLKQTIKNIISDKTKLSYIFAGLMALIAAFYIMQREQEMRAKYAEEKRLAYVLVAVRDIPAGTKIEEDMVRLETFPQKYLQPKAVASIEYVVGKFAQTDIMRGEMILDTKLSRDVPMSTLAARTPSEKRAMIIVIDLIDAVGGMVRPGDFVDVIGTFPYYQEVQGGEPIAKTITVTLFQNIEILAVAPVLTMSSAPKIEEEAPKLSVSLALSPREVSLMSYSLVEGKIKLVLRKPQDSAQPPIPPVDVNVLWDYILGQVGRSLGQPKPVLVPETIEVYRGSERSEMVLEK